MGIKVKEVSISYYPRTNEEGKKIGMRDGFRVIYCIWKYLRIKKWCTSEYKVFLECMTILLYIEYEPEIKELKSS